LVFTEEL